MKRNARLLLVMALLMLVSILAQAQTADVTATPPSIGINETITITASGLEASTPYTVEVLFDDAVIFATERTSNARGQLVLTLTSEPSDPFGDYVVQVTKDGEVVASTSFLLQEASSSQPDTPSAPDGTSANVTVSPSSAPVGNTHNILISGLEAGQAIAIQIRDGDDTIKYTRRLNADNNGRAQLRIFTEESEDEPGEYTVNVLNTNNEIIGIASLTIEDFVGRDGILEITPTSNEAGTHFTISATEVKPFADLTIMILNSQTNQSVFMTRQRADVEGTISLNYHSDPELEAGEYNVEVREGDIVVASGSFTVIASSAPTTPAQPDDSDESEEETTIIPATIVINPESGERGTVHAMMISDLEAGETVSFEVRLGGITLFETTRVADANGTFSIDIQSDPNDAFGVYEAVVLRNGDVIASANFTIARAVTQPDQPTPPTDVPVTTLGSVGSSTVYRGELTNASPEVEYTLNGRAGDLISITLESDDFDAYLKLLNNRGDIIAENDDGAGNLNSLISAFVIPDDGTYTIVASSYGYHWSQDVATGAYTLTVTTSELQNITIGETYNIAFSEDISAQFFAINAQVGEVLRVTVVGDGLFDTTLSLTDPDNFEVYYDDDGGYGFDPEIYRYVVTRSGIHVLTLATYTTGSVGAVDMLVEKRDVLSLNENAQTIQITGKINQEVLTYSGGTRGEAYTLEVVQVSGNARDLYITARQGDDMLMSYNTSYGFPNNITLGYILVSDEDVTITVETYGSSASFSLEVAPTR